MISILIFGFFAIIINFLWSLKLLEDIYVDLINLPWEILQTISIIFVITELKKYIVDFNLLEWLEFPKKFSLNFKIFIKSVTFFVKFIFVIYPILSFTDTTVFFYERIVED